VESENRYAGLVYPAEIFVVTGQNRVIGDVLHHAQDFLRPEMSVKEALAIFESAEADALAVIDDPLSRQVVGLLTEPYALKRYNEELDRKRRELAGE
jgi:CIC family chloride channel protein